MMHAKVLLLATVVAFPAWAGGDASDGHSHAAPAAAPVPISTAAPRAVAATEDFEVVAILEGKQLVVYVDRFASNEPVAKARVEVEGAGLKGFASEAAPGTYLMAVTAAIAPGKHPLTISIEAGDSADLLSAMLDTSQAAVADVDAHDGSRRVVWSSVALLLAAAALLVYRRGKARRIRG